MASTIYKLKEQQKRIEAARKEINSKIKKAELAEKKLRYEKAGKDLEQLFKSDPTCGDSKKIAAICAKYFVAS